MLSTADLERLITVKRREIQQEKTVLGLLPANVNTVTDKEKENESKTDIKVRFSRTRALSENNVPTDNINEENSKESFDLNEDIPPDLDRYIRRYIGLPVMLKAGEYSPNNPLIRGERTTGDALIGLGEYERRRNTLRKIRQRQYKEYLDQQAKIKQEAKEKAERERRENEERERLKEERERDRLETERENSPERRRPSISHKYITGANNTYVTKVDTGVQVDHRTTPLSVAVQTDDNQLFRLPSPAGYNLLTQAERELSPRTVARPSPSPSPGGNSIWPERRRSYGDFDDRPIARSTARDRLTSELRHSYMPSIFDSEAIRMRNEQAEREAAERRQYYQQELKNQILEQQRIKEERKTREKMLEQAEMRRLEEQLRSLKTAQEREMDRQRDIDNAMKDNASDYDKKRKNLQKEIDLEHEALLKAAIHPKRTQTSKSESPVLYKDTPYSNIAEPPYTNITDSSYSKNYDLESYLRRNLNPSNESLYSNKETKVIEKAIIHERPKKISPENPSKDFDKDSNRIEKYDNVRKASVLDDNDCLPIPVLRHSPKRDVNIEEKSDLSEKMQIVDDKWRVPAVQRNILKSLNEKGKNVSILTQLGSIRRQLQMEQLKLDKMLNK